MKVRRVVTGNQNGRAVIASDETLTPTTIALSPGGEFFLVWGEDAVPRVPADGTPPPCPTWFPRTGGFRFQVVTIPPDDVKPPPDLDLQKARAEADQKLPGMLDVGEPDAPGMHTTDSVDFIYLVSGHITLEVDDGRLVDLGPGDTVIQNGTRHAWRNRGPEPCVIVAVNIGAKRSGS